MISIYVTRSFILFFVVYSMFLLHHTTTTITICHMEQYPIEFNEYSKFPRWFLTKVFGVYIYIYKICIYLYTCDNLIFSIF